MAHSDIQTRSATAHVEKLLGMIEFRRFGMGFTLLVAAGFVAAWLVPDGFAHILITTVLTLLVVAGVLSIAGLATGFIVPSRQRKEDGRLDRHLLDRLPEGVLVTNDLNEVMYANPSYKNLSDQNKDRTQTIEELFSGHVAAAEPIYRLTQAIDEKKGWQEEFRITGVVGGSGDDNATASWYRISVDVLEDLPAIGSNGPLSIWQIAEITKERHRQEEAFGKLQEIIDYLDQAPAGFFSADADGRVDYLNATLAEWLGLDLADAFASQLTMKEIVSGDGAMLLEQALLTGNDEKQRVFDLDLIRQDGTSLPVRLLHKAQLNAEGVQQFRTLVLNRAPGAETGEDLRAAEVRFARFFHSAPIAIATIDEHGRVGSSNAAFARMFAKNILSDGDKGIDIVSLIEDDMKDEVSQALERASRGKVMISPLNVSFSGGKEQTGRLYFSPAGTVDKETGEEFGSAILYAIDTTDQRSLEMQMVQGQKMQAVGQLAGGIAHDFNNLLTAIILGTDELLGRHRPTDPGFKDIISIKQNANRAASLVRQILAFSRRQTLRPEVLNLNDVVSNLSVLLDRLLGENVKLHMDRNRDLWLVRADITQFEQVIINLAVNARDAMPAGGVVTITTRNISQRESSRMQDAGMQGGEYVLIQVADKGSGMTEEVREKVFEPFFTTKGVGKGTGLGLSMVYGIVKQTGGFIYIDSEVGEGTSFRIYLPRYEEEAGEVSDEKKDIKKSKPDLTGTETIMLVEDEEAVRGFSARALRKRGYEVFEAGTGVQALELMAEVEGRIDLVVSDVMMPEMDGPTMAKEMRRTMPDLKIIFVSGYAQDVLDEEDDFIFMSKPFGLKELAAKVKEVLEA